MALLNKVFKIVVTLSILNAATGYMYVKNSNQFNHWTGWFNSDDPTVTGDHETVAHIRRYEGKKCSHSVPCESPQAMEVRIVGQEVQQTAWEMMNCVYLRHDATNSSTGFYCLNQDQPGLDATAHCLEVCKNNDMVARGDEFLGCSKCPDFEVRYSCIDDTTKWDCDGTKPSRVDEGSDDDKLGQDAFNTFNPDQQPNMDLLISLLQQLLAVLTSSA